MLTTPFRGGYGYTGGLVDQGHGGIRLVSVLATGAGRSGAVHGTLRSQQLLRERGGVGAGWRELRHAFMVSPSLVPA